MTKLSDETKYPPYTYKYCNVVNGNMFWDYIQSNKDTLTYGEVEVLCDEFDTYRKQWHAHNEMTKQAV